MRRIAIAVFATLALALGGCGTFSIADPYGNEYGDWYNPGGNFTWQLGLCESQMGRDHIPPQQRKQAMRCCMRDHGVPVDDVRGCRVAG